MLPARRPELQYAAHEAAILAIPRPNPPGAARVWQRDRIRELRARAGADFSTTARLECRNGMRHGGVPLGLVGDIHGATDGSVALKRFRVLELAAGRRFRIRPRTGFTISPLVENVAQRIAEDLVTCIGKMREQSVMALPLLKVQYSLRPYSNLPLSCPVPRHQSACTPPPTPRGRRKCRPARKTANRR